MKIPYTFVLLSSCVMISSAMAMIEPSDGEVAKTPTTTLPLAHAPAADAAAVTGVDADLDEAPPAFDPTTTADDRSSPRRVITLNKPPEPQDDDSTDTEDSEFKKVLKMPRGKEFDIHPAIDGELLDE